MKDHQSKKYLTSSEYDQKWGMTVNTIGYAEIPENYEFYPTKGHPEDFDFNILSGRVLDSYQILYISEGKGVLYLSQGHPIPLEQGDLFIIRPNVWHSYFPLKETGWKEYWIGAEGKNINKLFQENFFSTPDKIFHIGIHDDIISLYLKAAQIAEKEEPFYQQALSGIVNMILGLTLLYDNGNRFQEDGIFTRIQQSKALIRENLFSDISPQEIAEKINMSYSYFRKAFKEYTQMSPYHYIQNLKFQKAKEMLVNTEMSIKEISYSLNYDNLSHFSTLFKKYIHMTPNEYRSIYGIKKKL